MKPESKIGPCASWSATSRASSFHRLLSTQREQAAQGEKTSTNSLLEFVKDPYVLEFLQLPDSVPLKESRLEQALIDELQKFLLELGKGFSFVARQMRISTETSHFYLDLVFYNYLLKCFVIVDLKIRHSSAIRTSVRWICMCACLMTLKRGEDDNPTIGIILCDSKDETVVKYSVHQGEPDSFSPRSISAVLPTEAELIAEIEREKRLIEGPGRVDG
jgi:predicted nuclease of restriction endonuclease-like (RecB) superfamily